MLPSSILPETEIDFSRYVYSQMDLDAMHRIMKEIGQALTQPITAQTYPDIHNLWSLLISRLPFAAVPVEVPFIIRARKSRKFEIFEDAADLSYNSKCPERIQPGRFNRAQEPIFYGTLPADHPTRYTNAAAIESFKELVSLTNTEDVLYFHIALFRVKKPIPVLNFCFEPRVTAKHPFLGQLIERQAQNVWAKVPAPSAGNILNFWRFVSEIASQPRHNAQHYLVSTALFIALRDYYEYDHAPVNGIIYPSPAVYGDAVNIALMPSAVDRFLAAEDVYILKYIGDTEYQDPRVIIDREGMNTDDKMSNGNTANKRRTRKLDMACPPSKITANGKLNIDRGKVVWGRERGGFSY